jgi:hypothetical protein
VAGAVLALVIAAVGWERQDDYLTARYAAPTTSGFSSTTPFAGPSRPRPANRRRGTSGAYNQYGFYGDELTNHVQYVGRNLPQADFRAITSCRAFREAVNDGDYDYLVTTPKLDLNDPATATPSPEGGWVMSDPAVERILHAGRTSVFRITGDLSPDGCAKGENRRSAEPEAGGSAAVKQ